jgi:hypothetical protein
MQMMIFAEHHISFHEFNTLKQSAFKGQYLQHTLQKLHAVRVVASALIPLICNTANFWDFWIPAVPSKL